MEIQGETVTQGCGVGEGGAAWLGRCALWVVTEMLPAGRCGRVAQAQKEQAETESAGVPFED